MEIAVIGEARVFVFLLKSRFVFRYYPRHTHRIDSTMSSPDDPGDKEHNNVPPDPVLAAIRAIRDITSKAGNKLLKADANTIAGHNSIIETQYLALIEKVRELELIKQSYLQSTQKKPNNPTPTADRLYSAVVANQIPKPKVDILCTVQVFPKVDPVSGEAQLNGYEATKQLLKQVQLKGSKVGIKHMKPIKGSGLSLLCRTRDEAKVLTEILKNQQKDTLQVKAPVKRNPTFTFLINGRDVNLVELKSDLSEQNEILNDPESFGLVHSYSTTRGNTIVVMEVSSGVYKSLCADGFFLFAGMCKVTLREQSAITQCHKCNRYGHKKTKCYYMVDGEPATRCLNCAGNHDNSQNCTGVTCCSNCKDFNDFALKRHWKLHNTDHKANDQECPMRLKALERARAYINYD